MASVRSQIIKEGEISSTVLLEPEALEQAGGSGAGDAWHKVFLALYYVAA